MATVAKVVKLIPARTAFLLCDIQTKFRPAIHGFDSVVATGNKLLKVARVLDVPVIVTEQNPKGLGKTDDRLDLRSLGPLHLATIEKSLFSMTTPEFLSLIDGRGFRSFVLAGIESHVCVLQSTLDLLERGYDVHVLADGVSSCNKEEVPWALERMRQAGAQITTSESVSFQLQCDAARPTFKAFSNVIKEEKEATVQTLQALLPTRHALL
ncbi:Isochorismatase-like protein [Russula earlei]|uniref:Isochorismatase-like protein n=1 Tax=Russula earlei TaxID=71964 RepID=A0ACC0UHJ0_9AGAM|nr:Isochorismatase-like protein [Russula earlei]